MVVDITLDSRCGVSRGLGLPRDKPIAETVTDFLKVLF